MRFHYSLNPLNCLLVVLQVIDNRHLQPKASSMIYPPSLNGAPNHDLLIEYGPICHIVKLPISMIRPFSLVNNSHITLYPQLEIIWKVSKSLRKYWGKYGQISFYIISCITRDCIIVENLYLVYWEISILTSTLPNIVKIASIVIEIWQKYS